MQNSTYFTGISSGDQLHKAYIRQAMQHHPERLGNIRPDLFQDGAIKAGFEAEVERVKAGMTTIMQQINAEFKKLKEFFLREELKDKTQGYWNYVGRTQKGVADAESYFNWATNRSQDIIDAVNRIIYIQGIEIEILKFWVWVGGETREVKELLKAAGYRWDPTKSKWVYRTCPAMGHFQTYEQVRAYHGAVRVENEEHDPHLVGAGA